MIKINADDRDRDYIVGMSDDLHKRYGAPVPRYTSYPSSPHFHTDIDAGTYGRWLGETDLENPVSLYLHVPFCTELCWYCGCNTRAVARYGPIKNYARRLAREMAMVADALPGRARVTHVHWGGGTPTALNANDFTALMVRLRCLFDISPSAEVAVEVDPRHLPPDMVDALAGAGVNRVSMGVQDFDPNVQAAINRIQTFEQTAHVISQLRSAGIHHFNLDLMYGLPHQTADGAARTATLAATLSPDRLSVFGYAHVPWMKAAQRLISTEALPDSGLRMAQAETIARTLRDAGYVRVGMDHYACADDTLVTARKTGKLRRNFQGYTTDDASTLIGLGASAIGSLPAGYVQNTSALRQYMAAIDGGAFATVRGIELSAEDRVRREIIQQLMCKFQADLASIAQSHGLGRPTFGPERARLWQFRNDGLIAFDGTALRVTELGRPFVRAIAAVFDRYLHRGAGRHSAAV